MFWTIGCIYGATSVAFGAFGAHGLKKIITDPARINNWSIASQYQVGCLAYLPADADYLLSGHPLRCPPSLDRGGTKECCCSFPLHSRHDIVQWQYLLVGIESTEIQDSRACDTD